MSNPLPGAYHFNHVSETLSRREPEQRSNLRHIYASLILERLNFHHP